MYTLEMMEMNEFYMKSYFFMEIAQDMEELKNNALGLRIKMNGHQRDEKV